MDTIESDIKPSKKELKIVNNSNILKGCSKACLDNEVECEFKECKYWIDYGADCNCDLISIHKNGEMTLRDIADRLNVSFVRIKQIESIALKKMYKIINKQKYKMVAPKIKN